MHETNSGPGVQSYRAEPGIRHLVAFRLRAICQKNAGSCAGISAYDDADFWLIGTTQTIPLSFAEIETCCQQHLHFTPGWKLTS